MRDAVASEPCLAEVEHMHSTTVSSLSSECEKYVLSSPQLCHGTLSHVKTYVSA